MKAWRILCVAIVFLVAACGSEATVTKPTPTRPPSGAVAGAHKVGETVTLTNHTITINSFERNEELIISVTLRNTGKVNLNPSPTVLFTAADSEGNWLPYHHEYRPAALGGTLVKGQAMTGEIYFEISPDQTGINLFYRPSELGLPDAEDVVFSLD